LDGTILANLQEAITSNSFLSSQKELVDETYKNDISYLSSAQEASDAYMSMKQRIPMVLEYYVTPYEIHTVEMYINPNKINMKHQKITSKTVTRGGIFFHHYGEDIPVMTISGNTGLSGMSGITELEKIFNYSGTLLRYQNVGVNKIYNGDSEPLQILNLEMLLNIMIRL
jgi:hypothetical protein